jgi:hypothetical protein
VNAVPLKNSRRTQKSASYFPTAGRGTGSRQLKSPKNAALWARLQKVKASARGKSIVNLLVSISQGGLSSIERMLYELDMSSLLPEKSVKIGSRSKKGRS